jgi:hypothetical protein
MKYECDVNFGIEHEWKVVKRGANSYALKHAHYDNITVGPLPETAAGFGVSTKFIPAEFIGKHGYE